MNSALHVDDISVNAQEYLESIYHLIRDKGAARVKDLAQANKVSNAAVVTALRRLQAAGLVAYTARELVQMTQAGQEVATKLEQRHQFLARFLQEVLGLEPHLAEQEACNLEHHLSLVTLERIAALFEFLSSCPEGGEDLIRQFRESHLPSHEPKSCAEPRDDLNQAMAPPPVNLSELQPGDEGRVIQLRGDMQWRRRLVDMGILPGAVIQVVRYAPLGDPIEIKISDYLLTLRRAEANRIVVTRVGAAL